MDGTFPEFTQYMEWFPLISYSRISWGRKVPVSLKTWKRKKTEKLELLLFLQSLRTPFKVVIHFLPLWSASVSSSPLIVIVSIINTYCPLLSVCCVPVHVYHASVLTMHISIDPPTNYCEDTVLVCVIKGKQGKKLSSSSQSGRVSWDSNPSSWLNQNRLFPDPPLAPLGAVTVNPTSTLLSSQSGCLRTCSLLDGQFEPLELSLLGSSQLTRPPPALEHSLPLRLCRETERLKEKSCPWLRTSEASWLGRHSLGDQGLDFGWWIS